MRGLFSYYYNKKILANIEDVKVELKKWNSISF